MSSNEPLPLVHDESSYDPEAGKTLGYVLVATAVLSFVPFISGFASLATVIIASVLVCGCCCAREYNMEPKTRGYAKGVIWAGVLSFVLGIVYFGIVFWYVYNQAQASSDLANATEQEIEDIYGNLWQNFGTFSIGATIVGVFMLIATVVVLVFSCLFAFKR